jgi:dihydrofolate synthase / folylpolyglutamate synthase
MGEKPGWDPAAERLAPWLERLVNYERTRPDRRLWDLANMQRLLARPGAAAKQAPAVQVGGSKGKGTTCAFLAALAERAGLLPGVYLSPHLDTLLERIRIGERLVEVTELEACLRLLVEHAQAQRIELTFFEAMTAAAVEVFAAHRVDLVVWEVGLGGRFDATTAVPVDASIVTTIELEHTEVLGDTRTAIAGEKAPVIRPGGIGFTGVTDPEALAVIERHASTVGARLVVLGRELRWAAAELQRDAFRGRLRLPDGRELPVTLPDARAFEVPALALAAAALAQLCPDAVLHLDPAPRPTLPCRFEVLAAPDGAPVILDGAHTEASLASVAQEVQRRWPRRRIAVLFGSAAGKRWREALYSLLSLADRFVVTAIDGTTSEDPAVIADWLREQGMACSVERDIDSALASLVEFEGPRLCVGSFYLVGQARRALLAMR